MTKGWLLTRMVAVSPVWTRAGLEGSCLISEAQPPLLAGTGSAFSSGKEGWCPQAGGLGDWGKVPGGREVRAVRCIPGAGAGLSPSFPGAST